MSEKVSNENTLSNPHFHPFSNIIVQADKLNGGRNLSLSLDDARGMTESTTRPLQRGNKRST